MHPESLRRTAQSARLLLGSVALATLAACASYSGIAPVTKPLDASSLGLTNLDASFEADRVATDTDWWRGFGSAQLNTLVATALEHNPGLKVAQARLARARAGSAVANAADGPQINGALASLLRGSPADPVVHARAVAELVVPA